MLWGVLYVYDGALMVQSAFNHLFVGVFSQCFDFQCDSPLKYPFCCVRFWLGLRGSIRGLRY